MSKVAPHEGAWIEIHSPRLSSYEAMVAPHEGAWIEIGTKTMLLPQKHSSHPTRVRGLK